MDGKWCSSTGLGTETIQTPNFIYPSSPGMYATGGKGRLTITPGHAYHPMQKRDSPFPHHQWSDKEYQACLGLWPEANLPYRKALTQFSSFPAFWDDWTPSYGGDMHCQWAFWENMPVFEEALMENFCNCSFKGLVFLFSCFTQDRPTTCRGHRSRMVDCDITIS